MCSFIVADSKEDKVPWSDAFFDITPGELGGEWWNREGGIFLYYSGYIYYLGAKIGEPNGLRLLLDAEVYDHGPGHAISQVQLKLTFSDVI